MREEEESLTAVSHIHVYGPAYAVCIRACALIVLMLEGLTAVPK